MIAVQEKLHFSDVYSMKSLKKKCIYHYSGCRISPLIILFNLWKCQLLGCSRSRKFWWITIWLWCKIGECIIIIFDLTSKVTYKSVLTCYHHLVCAYENISIDSRGSKTDAIKKKTQNKVGFFPQIYITTIIHKANVLLLYLIWHQE